MNIRALNSMLNILERSYTGNIGFEEMVNFYQKASDEDVSIMERIIKNDDWEGFKKLILKVLGVRLQ